MWLKRRMGTSVSKRLDGTGEQSQFCPHIMRRQKSENLIVAGKCKEEGWGEKYREKIHSLGCPSGHSTQKQKKQNQEPCKTEGKSVSTIKVYTSCVNKI